MIKIKTGTVLGGVTEAGDISKEIVIPTHRMLGLKDCLIGGGMVLAGIAYFTYAAFMNGAKAFEREELWTMKDCGIIDEYPDDCINHDKWKWSLK